WRAAFAVLTAVAWAKALLLAYFPKPRTGRQNQRLSTQLRILRDPRLLGHVMLSLLVFTGMFTAYTYLADMLEHLAGFDGKVVGWTMMAFGGAGILGNWLGGRLVDRSPLGATILSQSLWMIGGAVAVFIVLWLFFTRTLIGRAVLATSNNRLAARLVGINTRFIMTLSFALSAAIGALAGVLITPITLTSYDVDLTLALKGFAAAMLGGMGSPKGALAGGILLGLLESLTAGYLSSQYKDAAAFLTILAVLFFMPQGLFGHKSTDRV
ncbi:hypothetical protein OMF39_14140, partial [Bordetella pertussis]